MIKIIQCRSYKQAINKSKNLQNIVAIETEYGDEYFGKKDGAEIELLHHGKFENLPASIALIPKDETQNVNYRYNEFIVSHIDLDTVFGIMWAGGYLKNTYIAREISKLVAYLDEHGFYNFKNNLLDKTNQIHVKFLAITSIMNFWKIRPRTLSYDIHKLILRIRDYIVLPIPQDVKKYILVEEETHFLDDVVQPQLNISNTLITYVSYKSVTNHYLYNGDEYEMILQYNLGSQTITLSCQDEAIAEQYFGEQGVVEPLQKFFGHSAGGHKSIGGSPRNKKLSENILKDFFIFLQDTYL